MKFLWTTLTVRDLEASLRFYTEVVGLPVARRLSPRPGFDLVFLGEGETLVELIRHEGVEAPAPVGNPSIGFRTESLADLQALLAARGIPVHSGPFQANPTMSYLFVEDPDGLLVQFVEDRA